ncbi:MAG: ABC transporter permease [Rhodothermaceae bacterium]
MKLAEKIIRLFFKDENDTKLGDFLEMYHLQCESDGKLRAFFWLWIQIFTSIPKLLDNKIYWGGAMLINYLKITIRNLTRNKLYSFINLSGLSVGISCCLLLVLWCVHELSYDKFHHNSERSFVVFEKLLYPDAPPISHMSTPHPLAPLFKSEYPEVEYATRIQFHFETPIAYKDKRVNQSGILFVDNDFFHIYNYPLISGDKEKLLTDPFSVVLTESTAKKYFGDENPIGKVFQFSNNHNVTVTGVLKNLPDNTVWDFEMLFAMEGARQLIGQRMDIWGNNNPRTSVTLRSGTNINDFEKKIYSLLSQYTNTDNTKLMLQPIKDSYLYELEGEDGNITYVYIFALIGFFILLIACINFMNLSTARSLQRAKEIGLRKAVGVRKSQLVTQFLGESVFSAFIAMVLGFVISYLLLPLFNDITGKQFDFSILFSAEVLIFLAGITLITGLISGIYPALYLSSFDPKLVLSGVFKTGKKGSGFRHVLTVVQFTISVVLIIATFVVSYQLDYIHKLDLGYDKDKLIRVNLSGNSNSNFTSFRNELIKNNDIVDVTRSNRRMTSTSNSSEGFSWPGKDPQSIVRMNFTFADYHYLNTMGFELIEGSDFTQKYIERALENTEIILNEEALRRMGLEDPIGKELSWGPTFKGVIKGIVKDFHYSSLKDEIIPMVIMNNYRNVYYSFIKFSGNDLSEVVEEVKTAWAKTNPDIPITFSFMDETLERLYKNEIRIKKIFNNFAFLTIFIACLGLIGMASYTVERKSKEISIRKVLGASVNNLMMKYVREFLKWIVFANLIAIPLAYYLMEKWLTGFAYRMEISFDIFLITGGITILIAAVTVSFQLLKAALGNPVEILRAE